MAFWLTWYGTKLEKHMFRYLHKHIWQRRQNSNVFSNSEQREQFETIWNRNASLWRRKHGLAHARDNAYLPPASSHAELHSKRCRVPLRPVTMKARCLIRTRLNVEWCNICCLALAAEIGPYLGLHTPSKRMLEALKILAFYGTVIARRKLQWHLGHIIGATNICMKIC